MTTPERQSVFAIPAAIVVAGLVGWAGSQGGDVVAGLPTYAIVVAVAFVMQWLAFIPAFLAQTERFFDITGSVTYITVAALAVLLSGRLDARGLLLLALITVWAVRLGSFLVRRIHRAGKDERFDDIKPSVLRFLMTWTLQGLWVSMTLAAALAAMTTKVRQPLGPIALIGLGIWVIGILLEATADWQKSRFRRDAVNRGAFIESGLWRWSRHPNYFGEIVLWIGIAVIALPVLRGWQWVTLISPVFVTLLLTRVSGIPMLEKRADAKWGGQPDYERYKARTSILILWPPKQDRS